MKPRNFKFLIALLVSFVASHDALAVQWLKQSTAKAIQFGPLVDKADGVTLKTGLVSALDHASTGIFISKNGGALAVRHATVTASTYDAYGNYLVTLDATDTGTLGPLRVQYADATTCLPVWRDFIVVPANTFDTLVAGTANLNADAKALGGSTTPITNLNTVFNTDYATNYDATNHFFNTNFAQALPSVPVANSHGEALFLADIMGGRINTAAAGASTTITLDASASSDSNSYVGDCIYLYGGMGGGIRGSGQRRTILSYNGSTKVATVDRAWTTTPDNTSKFIVLPQPLSLAEVTGHRTFYVSLAGSDSNVGYRYTQPFLTGAAAIAAARPYDEIIFKPGDYHTAEPYLDFAGKPNITVRGVSRTGVIIGTVLAESGTKVHTLTITATADAIGPEGSVGIYANNKTGIGAYSLDINAAYDGIININGYGLRAHDCKIEATYDDINVDRAVNYDIGYCRLRTTGDWTGAAAPGGPFGLPDTRNIVAVEKSQGLIHDTVCIIEHGAPLAGSNVKGICVQVGGDPPSGDPLFGTLQSKIGQVELRNVRMYGRKGHSTDAGNIYAVAGFSAGGFLPIYNLPMTGCSADITTNGTGTAYDLDASNASTKVMAANSWIDPAKCLGLAQITSDLRPTSAFNKLDVTATGAAGMDWGNVENKTTTNVFSGTTVGTATTLGQTGIDAIHDDSLANNTTAGTAGKALADASAAGNPWTLTLSGNNTNGTFGYLMQNAFGVSPFNVDEKQTWSFDSRDQLTSPDIQTEFAGEATIFKAMDFSEPLTEKGSIGSITSVTVEEIDGQTAPTVIDSAISSDRRHVNITIDGTLATPATYTVVVKIVTTDSRTFTRKGKLTLQ